MTAGHYNTFFIFIIIIITLSV